MEDALVPKEMNLEVMTKSVLILVLMEDALVHCRKRCERPKGGKVLILVLMEDALVH